MDVDNASAIEDSAVGLHPDEPPARATTGTYATEALLTSADGCSRPVVVSSSHEVTLAIVHQEPGLLELEVAAPHLAEAPVLIRGTWPIRDALSVWRPQSIGRKDLPGDWSAGLATGSTRHAPVASLVGADDDSILTASLSAAVRSCDLALAVNEESGEAVLHALVRDVEAADGAARFRCRIDTRRRHFAAALRQVTDQWHEELGDRVPPVPPVALRPMYSTWYSDHQSISAASVEDRAQASAGFGCQAIIVDDGWQTDDTARGYAYCGDWEPTATSFPDMAGHVARVRALGMRYLLWIAAPFVGRHSRAWERLQPFALSHNDGLGAAVLDPRYPEVREYVVDTCLRPMREWGVDGLKIDFIDSWFAPQAPHREGMDCRTVDEGVERILQAVADGCRALRGDLLVEFRQDYVSPRLWPYGTIIRAADCPLDAVENRVRTIDLRLLAGDRAVHSDMLMWHPDATPEDVARQFVAVLFSVPQVSVDPRHLSPEHAAVMRHWLGFVQEHADVLLHGELRPSRPDARYSQVRASNGTTRIVVAYTDPVVELTAAHRGPWVIVNGTSRHEVFLRTDDAFTADVVVQDCAGRTVRERAAVALDRVSELEVPECGLAMIAPAR